MTITRRTAAIGSLSLLAGTSMSTPGRADWDGPIYSAVEGIEEFWLATDAYIFGYPLVTLEMTRRVVTKVDANEGLHAPMGQFAKVRTYPNAVEKVAHRSSLDRKIYVLRNVAHHLCEPNCIYLFCNDTD
jgi:hypothetical protein